MSQQKVTPTFAKTGFGYIEAIGEDVQAFHEKLDFDTATKYLESGNFYRNSELHNIHLTGHRPWGTYTVLEDSPGYKIKRIEVKPGKRLSLQKHFHRNEHWIVVSGNATVTVGDETKYIRQNESTYIKMGEIHRLANDGARPVVLIEAQVSEYRGEDNIVRIDDDLQRD